MPFKFKLSKRLALLKASLAASAALALACDRVGITSPQSLSRPLAEVVTSLSPISVVASGDDGNVASNTLDNSLGTRWSAYGDGVWIRYDLGTVGTMDRVNIAWYKGDTRMAYFDIQVSEDALTWTRVFSGHGSGQTVQFESYDFPASSGRYLRIVGHGNNLLTGWTSITEVAISATAPSAPVVASAHDGNIPENTLDNSLATRWSAYGDGQWIRYDLGALMPVSRLDVAWYRGSEWASAFGIQVSPDAVTWTNVFAGRSSGRTLEPETYLFPVVSARYVRIVGHGQWSGTTQLSLWNSITEVHVSGATAPAATDTVLPVASVMASAHDGNVPANTLDNNLTTRWSASGDGQWIRYDLGTVVATDRVDIAWYLGDPVVNGPARFDVEVSLTGVAWAPVFSGQSSGQTVQPEPYAFPAAYARYLRVVGHGNSKNAWNSITEVKMHRAPDTVTIAPVATVIVNPASASTSTGTNAQLSAVTKDAAGNTLTGRPVTWTSSNPAVAMVSASGLVTGVAAGSATITATSEGKSAAATVTVSNAPVASVMISPATATLLLGASLQFSATLRDSAGNILTGRSVTWGSDNAVVAVVSASGLVSGLALGTATISATSEGKSGTAAITLTTATSTARHYYGAPTGNDANSCSAVAPCYTMQRISQLLAPGDTAHFAPGNYTWSYSGNRVTKSGAPGALITYISDTKWGAKIYGSDCSPITNEGEYVQIVNFDVTGSCNQGITTNGSYSKIIGNRVHDMPGTSKTGAIVGSCCDYSKVGIEIIGNVVDNIGPWGQVNQTHGIYMASARGVVANNIITRAASACIQTYHGATRLIIANNVVANCGRYGIQISGDPAVVVNDYTTVVNNIVVNVNGYGIWESSSGATGPHNVFYNNIVYNNAPNMSLASGTQAGTVTLTSSQFAALFVNYTGDIRGDYHLRSGAVAIDAGTASCAAGVSRCVLPYDLEGVLRPRGVAYDIGAFEY